ncbi:myocyte-specific enhancer factor 2D [Brachyhypopomus gauderio]|uniref:myocyte-specific enhancer factor 2D n=1 Tax=Brachyhypopomus gauderio TaxID=698409 RepID=UPI0040431E60
MISLAWMSWTQPNRSGLDVLDTTQPLWPGCPGHNPTALAWMSWTKPNRSGLDVLGHNPTALAWMSWTQPNRSGLDVLDTTQPLWPGCPGHNPTALAWMSWTQPNRSGLDVLDTTQPLWPGCPGHNPTALAWMSWTQPNRSGLDVLDTTQPLWPGCPGHNPTASEYQLTSADLTALQAFTPQGALLPSNVASWQQQQQQPSVSQQPQQQPSVSQQQPQQTQQTQQISLNPLNNLIMWGVDRHSGEVTSCMSGLAANLSVTSQGSLLLGREEGLTWPVGPLPHGATLTVNTNPGVSIKSEPVSPNRDRSTPSSTATAGVSGAVTGLSVTQYPGALRLEPTGRSPVDSISSNGSSYEGSDRDEGGRTRPPDFTASALGQLRPSAEQTASSDSQDGASIKRMRLDTWVT